MALKADESLTGEQGVDRRVLLQVAAGDRQAFEQLFENYHRRLFRFLFRLTRSHGEAEELTNDVLLTVWSDAGKYRGDAKVSTWIFGIAYRKSLARLRKRKLKLVSFEDKHAQVDHPGDRFEEADWVQHGVEALPAKQRLTVMLVYFLGMSCEETAVATGVPASTVKTRMFHARRKLKLHLASSRLPARRDEDEENDHGR